MVWEGLISRHTLLYFFTACDAAVVAAAVKEVCSAAAFRSELQSLVNVVDRTLREELTASRDTRPRAGAPAQPRRRVTAAGPSHVAIVVKGRDSSGSDDDDDGDGDGDGGGDGYSGSRSSGSDGGAQGRSDSDEDLMALCMAGYEDILPIATKLSASHTLQVCARASFVTVSGHRRRRSVYVHVILDTASRHRC